MSDQILEQLFESTSKVKLLKLFLRNQKSKFIASDACSRAQIDSRSGHKALERLRKAGVLKCYGKTYFINPSFMFFDELRSLVLKSSPASKSRMLKRIKGLGRVKLVVLSGIFMRPDRELSRTDLLVVGDDVSQKRLLNFLKQLEAEVGCEIQYSLLSSDEFNYRRKMLDRFLRDVLERPNEILINKLLV
jgi:predicted nucleotidyltransferase